MTIKLAVALPAYNSTLDVGHAAMWVGLGMAISEAKEHFELVSFANYSINGVDLARNTCLYDALQTDATWMLSFDADTFHAGAAANDLVNAGVQILQMIRDADRLAYVDEIDGELRAIPLPAYARQHTGVGLIGAPVFGRGIGSRGVCVVDELNQQIPLPALANKVSVVARIGGAAIALNLNWFRQYWPTADSEPWFYMEHDYSARPKNARGEDYSVCDGISDRGGLVLCDGRFVPAHVDRRRLVGEGV